MREIYAGEKFVACREKGQPKEGKKRLTRKKQTGIGEDCEGVTTSRGKRGEF